MPERGRLPRLALLLCSLLLPAAAWAEELVLGVFAFRPKAIMLRKYQPLAEYLGGVQPGLRVRLEVLDQDEMDAAMRNNELDLVFTNPSHFLMLRHQQRLSGAIATLEAKEDGLPASALGGVIIARAAQQDIRELKDVRGRRIAIPGTRYLGGYQAQAYELLQAGIVLPGDAQLLTVGSHDAVVQAVLAGRADVGFIRIGILESLAQEDPLGISRLRVIHRQNMSHFPFQVSTRLYPEWAFAALPHLDGKLVRRLTAALLSIEPDSPVALAAGIQGFTVPADYLPVEALARALRQPPFDHAPAFTASDVWSRFRPAIIALSGLGLVILAMGAVLAVTNRRLRVERGRVASILEGTHVGTWEWNVQSGEVVFNERWAEIVGHTLQELSPLSIRCWIDLAHPDDLKKSNELLQRHFRGELDYYECECRMRHKDGRWVWVLDRGRVSARAPDGRPLLMSGTHMDITERKRMEEELIAQATTDMLTGLANRRHFFARLAEESARLQRLAGQRSALLVLDIDYFKQVNDSMGHAAGDAVLRHLAAILQGDLRGTDLAGRIGGEEFAIILPGARLQQGVVRAERLRQRIAAAPARYEGREIAFTASFGVTEMSGEDAETGQSLLRADRALYRAKLAGRNRVEAQDLGPQPATVGMLP